MIATPPQPPLPVLSERQAALLDAFLNSQGDLRAFAKSQSLSAAALAQWFADPAIQAHLHAIQAAADLSAALRATDLRREALDDLHAISKTTEDPVEKRRAAAAIARSAFRPTSPFGGGAAARGGGGGSRSTSPSPSSSRLLRIPRITTRDGEPVPPLYLHSNPHFDPPKEAEDLMRITALALYSPSDAPCMAAIHGLLADNATINEEPAEAESDDFRDQAAAAFEYPPVVTHIIYVRRDPDGQTARYCFCLCHGPQAPISTTSVEMEAVRADDGWRIASLYRKPDSG